MALKMNSLSGSYNECCPLLIGDEEDELVVVCARGSIIQVLSSKSGSLLGTFDGHRRVGYITSITQYPGEKGVIISASSDGMICIWNLKSCVTVVEFYVKGLTGCIYEMIAVDGSGSAEPSDGFPLASIKLYLVTDLQMKGEVTTHRQKCYYQLVQLDMKSQKVFFKPAASLDLSRKCVSTIDSSRFVSSSATYDGSKTILTAASKKKIHLISTGSSAATTMFTTNSKSNITCLDTNSETGIIVTGHASGEMLIWHGVPSFLKGSMAASQPRKKSKSKSKSPASIPIPVSTSLHWHAHAVSSLALSVDGLRLYSGGEEGVLLLWSIPSASQAASSTATVTRCSYLPRLGAPIVHVSATTESPGTGTGAGALDGLDLARLVVTTADNSLRLVNSSSLKIEWSARSICITSRKDSVIKRKKTVEDAPSSVTPSSPSTPTSAAVAALPAPYTKPPSLPFLQSDLSWCCFVGVEPRSNHIVCNGYPGALQTMDPGTQMMSQQYEVVNFTRVSKKEKHSKIFLPSITLFKFASISSSSSGNYISNSNNSSNGSSSKSTVRGAHIHIMVTVDVRRGECTEAGVGGDISIKFWEWASKKGAYRLSAQMDQPHGNIRVTDIALSCPASDSGAHCLSSAVDGSVKMWKGVPQSLDSLGRTTGTIRWHCAYSFKFRDCPAGSLAFSSDGSLFAVSHHNLLTLWDPVAVTQKASIVGCSANNILFVRFVEPGHSSHWGGGTGSAALVLGSRRNLSVYDLLSMKLLWERKGHFTCFNTADDDSKMTFAAGEGWIAVGANMFATAQEDEGQGEDQGVFNVKDEEDNHWTSEGGATSASTAMLLVLPLYDPRPLAVHKVSAKINSVTFWDSHEGEGERSPPGVFMVTENSELLTFSHTPGNGGDLDDRTYRVDGGSLTPAARLAGNSARAMHVTPGTTDGASDPSILALRSDTPAAAILSSAAMAVPLSSNGWLRGILDENTANVPTLSSLSQSFLAQLLRPRPAEHYTTATTAPASKKARTGAYTEMSAGARRLSDAAPSSTSTGSALSSSWPRAPPNTATAAGAGAGSYVSLALSDSNSAALQNHFMERYTSTAATSARAVSVSESSSKKAKKNTAPTLEPSAVKETKKISQTPEPSAVEEVKKTSQTPEPAKEKKSKSEKKSEKKRKSMSKEAEESLQPVTLEDSTVKSPPPVPASVPTPTPTPTTEPTTLGKKSTKKKAKEQDLVEAIPDPTPTPKPTPTPTPKPTPKATPKATPTPIPSSQGESPPKRRTRSNSQTSVDSVDSHRSSRSDTSLSTPTGTGGGVRQSRRKIMEMEQIVESIPEGELDGEGEGEEVGVGEGEREGEGGGGGKTPSKQRKSSRRKD